MGDVISLCSCSAQPPARERLAQQVELHTMQVADLARQCSVIERASEHLVAASLGAEATEAKRKKLRDAAREKLRQVHRLRQQEQGLQRIISVCRSLLQSEEQGSSLRETVSVMRSFRPRSGVDEDTVRQLDRVFDEFDGAKAVAGEIEDRFKDQADHASATVDETDLEAELEAMERRAAAGPEPALPPAVALPAAPKGEPLLKAPPQQQRIALFTSPM